MLQRISPLLAILALLCLHSAGATLNATEAPEVCASDPEPEIPRPSGVCYVSETKAAKLSSQMTIWTRALSLQPADDRRKLLDEVVLEPITDSNLKTICSDYRIARLEDDFSKVVKLFWHMSIALTDPSDAEFESLEVQKNSLVQHLSELKVYTVQSSVLMVSHTFMAQVRSFDTSLETAFNLFSTPSKRIQAMLLEPGQSPSDFAALAQQYPEEAAEALPQLLANMYSGNLSNFDSTFQFAGNLSTTEQKIQGYVTLYDQMRNNSQLDTYELTRLLVQVKQTPALPSSAPTALQSQFTKLKQDYAQFMGYFSRSHSCNVRSVALSQVLATIDPGWPEYTVVAPGSNTLPFSPQNAGLSFRIRSGGSILHARPGSTYDSSKRHILESSGMDVPSDAWKDWKLVPVDGGKYFKILNAQYDEVMFVDPSATHGGHRRVFLKRFNYSGVVVMPTNGDLWSLECTPA